MTTINKYITTLLLCITTLSGCKEEYVYPSVSTEFCDVKTTPDGRMKTLLTDKNRTLYIKVRTGIDGFAKDSTYRCVAKFSVAEENDSTFLYSLYPTVSNQPTPINEFLEKNKTEVKRDPVTIQRMWGSERYINMVLLQKRKDIPHLYHLIEEGKETDENGKKTVNILLFHDRMKDYEAFNGEVYVSIPLYEYNAGMNNGDRIKVKISTYENENDIRIFEKKNKNWILTE